ncbi:peptidoglycan amidohydrolase family protein [Anaerococcus cruorum]|uniref:Peptidoglycan amidohydrolase family protein n=1 Tax=Anaerococcus cruorum TaxID=3115617 RepID=A0ABW9MWA6_9FIRM
MGVKEALKWLDDHHRHKGNYPYSMVKRNGNPGFDCSSAMYYALIAGGVLPKNTPIGNTETLFKLNGKYLDEIYSYKEVQAGDIFIRGGEGTSAGAAGHTGMFYKKDGIIHSNYSNNGISYNNNGSYIGYFLDRRRSRNERYFRPRYPNTKRPNTSKPRKSVTGKKWIKNENWHGITQAACHVRSEASLNAPIVATYPMGARINYDSVYEADGYRWLSYVSYSGQRRYVAYRRTSGNTRSWITF